MLGADNFDKAVQTLLYYSALSIAFNVTVWAVCDKYNAWEKYDYKLSHKFGDRCMLCIPFWFSVIYTIVIAFISKDWFLLISPFLTAGLTLKISGKK